MFSQRYSFRGILWFYTQSLICALFRFIIEFDLVKDKKNDGGIIYKLIRHAS